MALEHNTNLHTLQLSCNRIDDVGCQRLAQAFRKNTTVHTVCMHVCPCELLKTECQSLDFFYTSQLHLDRNNARDEFGVELGQTLMVNNTLRYLDLSENDIRAQGLYSTRFSVHVKLFPTMLTRCVSHVLVSTFPAF
jgi:hypothetical protein